MGLASNIDHFGDKVVNNRTFKYLVPPLGYYGASFRANLARLTPKAFGVGDEHLKDSKHFRSLPCIYVLYNSSVREKVKEEVISWFYNQDYFIEDLYLASHTNPLKLLVIQFPTERFPNAYKMFFLGKYSKMYDAKDIDKFFDERTQKKSMDVLKRKQGSVEKHINKVNKEFGTNILLKDVGPYFEADFKITKEEEYFNY